MTNTLQITQNEDGTYDYYVFNESAGKRSSEPFISLPQCFEIASKFAFVDVANNNNHKWTE